MTDVFRVWKKHALVLAVILLPVFAYLAVKAQDPRGWDQWGFGSAQTVLTVRHWARDGMIAHKFLFLPSGYHPNIGFLDRPEFRFLADGTKTGETIGNRLYYTHYPAGYLIPYGLLAKLGVMERSGLRVVAVLFSMLGLAFFYGFVFLFSKRNHWIAGAATLYYATTTVFLGYADSLANQSIDDLFRNAVLFVSFYRFSSVSDGVKKKRLTAVTWVLYFLLASSSYDSTFFVFIWLCGLDILEHRRLRIGRFIGWGLAPVLAFVVQVAQNTWYLGVADMLRDFYGALAFRSSEAPAVLGRLPPLVKNAFASLSLTGYLAGMRARFALPVVALLVFAIWRTKLVDKTRAWLLVILAAAGMTYPFLLPVVGTFGYQGRQLAPTLCTLIAIATYAVVTKWRALKWSAALLAAPLVILWAIHVRALAGFVNDFPQNAFTDEQVTQWTSYMNYTKRNDVILLSAQLGSEKFFMQVYADRLILPLDDAKAMSELASAIQKTIGDGRVIIVTDLAVDGETKKVFAEAGLTLAWLWTDAGLTGYVLVQTLQP
ncbi:MAG: hypothetical protein AAB668_03930 [Patescibacteria group bacterium]